VAAALLRRPWRTPRLLGVLPVLGLFALGRRDRGQLKSAVIRAVFAGWRRQDLERAAQRYAERRVPSLAFPAARQAIARHRADGDLLVLLSASPDLYVPALGRALGFDRVICTGISWRDDRLEGFLTTANRRGEEKLVCLRSLQAEMPGLPVTAYGNADSDLPHLEVCEVGCYINAPARRREALMRRGLQVLDWH
jgi:phosphatidylglycerophosphatase C